MEFIFELFIVSILMVGLFMVMGYILLAFFNLAPRPSWMLHDNAQRYPIEDGYSLYKNSIVPEYDVISSIIDNNNDYPTLIGQSSVRWIVSVLENNKKNYYHAY